MRLFVDTIFEQTRVILAEGVVYSLSLSDVDQQDNAFLHYQHFVRQCVNVINSNIYVMKQNTEHYVFDETQLQLIARIEKYFQELTQYMDTWSGTNFRRTIFR